MDNFNVNMRATALVLLSFLSYNVADAFVKHLLSIYYFAEAAFYPTVIYALFVIIFHRKFGGIKSLFTSKKTLYHFMRGFFGTGCYVSFVVSIQYITLAQAYTLLLTSPFWIAILSIFFFREHIGIHRWAAIFVGFIGVLVVMRPGLIPLEPASFLMIFGALCFSMFIIYTKKIGPDEPLISMVMFPIIAEAIILVPMIIYNGVQNDAFTMPRPDHILFFTLGGLCYLIGTSLSSLGFSSGESSMLAPLHYSQIIWGALIGYFIFAETPESWTMLGAGIIIASGVYLINRERKAHAKPYD
jgi:drug/metabolite transporter (DMT)-like permease